MKFQWIKPVSALFMAVAVASCGGTIKGTTKTFMTYTDPQTGQSKNLQLQLLKPASTVSPLENGLYPGIVFVHGGSWSKGGRLDVPLQNEIVTASNNGYVAVSIDYRMIKLQNDTDTSSNLYPWAAQIQDVKCAIRWMKANAAELKLDVNRIGIWGESSGGHLALTAGETAGASDYEAPECTHDANSQVNAVVAYAPVSDFSTTWKVATSGLNKSMLSLVAASEPPKGVDGHTKAPEYRNYDQLTEATRTKMTGASPINKVTSTDVPVLLAHANNDDFVIPENSWQFFEKLNEFNRTAYLLRLDRGWHFAGSDADDATRFTDEQMYKWFDRHLKGLNVTMQCGDNTDCAVVVPEYPE